MATTRFETTIHAIQGGLKNFTIEKATQNIEGWEDYLSKHDHEGVKKVVQDLGKLKKLLHAKEIDGEAVKTIITKMGKDTVAVAGDSQDTNSKHIRDLGEALSQAAGSQNDGVDGAKKDVAESKGSADEEITHAEHATKTSHAKK